jgi:hypothetical protein
VNYSIFTMELAFAVVTNNPRRPTHSDKYVEQLFDRSLSP